MRMGTAARQWERLCPSDAQYEQFLRMLERIDEERSNSSMELCYKPFSVVQGLRASLVDPPATLLVMPNGLVKVAAALPLICADLRAESVQRAWESYCGAWRDAGVRRAACDAIADEARHAEANLWRAVNGLQLRESMEMT